MSSLLFIGLKLSEPLTPGLGKVFSNKKQIFKWQEFNFITYALQVK